MAIDHDGVVETSADARDLDDSVPCGLLSWSVEGVVTDVNATMLSLLGYPREELLGVAVKTLLSPGDLLFFETRVASALRLRGEVREVATAMVRADGRRLPILVNARMHQRPGADPQVRAAVFEITERADLERTQLAARRAAEATEARLRVLQEASTRFAGATSTVSLGAALSEITRCAFSAATTGVLLFDQHHRLTLVAGEHPLHTAPSTTADRTPEVDALARRRTVTVGNLDDADSAYPGLGSTMRAARLASLTATPILDGDRTLGVLMCFFRRHGVVDEAMVELQEALARQAAQVALRLRAEEARRQDRDTADRLRERIRQVSATVRATCQPQAMVQTLAEGVGEALAVDGVRIGILAQGEVPRLDVLWLPGAPGACDPLPEDELHTLTTALWWEEDNLRLTDLTALEPVSSRRFLAPLGAGQRSSSMVVPIGDREVMLGVIALVINEPGRSWTPIEYSLVRSLATDLAHNLRLSSLLLAQEETVERLRQLDQEKTDLIASVNHELRTPLTSITAYVDLIQERVDVEMPATIGPMLAIIQRNVERLNSLIAKIQVSAQHSSDANRVRISVVDMAELIRTVVLTLTPRAAGAGVELDVDVREKLLVRGDRDGLEQVVVVVVENAIKFSAPGAVVRIRAALDVHDDGSGRVVTSVRDTGIGISTSDLPRIGSKLFRASNAINVVPGTGLGLSIARGILASAGGDLTITSQIGVGTEVTIAVPVVDARAA